MIEIPLTYGYVAIVNDEDSDLDIYHWTTSVKSNSTIRYARKGQKDDRRIMHRMIMERMLSRSLVKGEIVDHKDGDGLNNQRSNLRLCTHTQNLHNRKTSKRNASGLKGVSVISQAREFSKNKWCAYIRYDGKTRNLGSFPTPEAAHAAYCEAAKEHFGEFWRAA